MLGPLLALALLATAPAAPAAPAVPPAPVVVASGDPDAPASLEAPEDAPLPPMPASVRVFAVRRAALDAAVEELNAALEAQAAAAEQLREVRSDTSFAARRGMMLALTNLAGDISVEAWHRNSVRIVTEHARRDRVDAHVENGTLIVRIVNPRGEASFGDVHVSLPDWMPLRVASIESPIRVAGMRAAVEAGSVRGDVMVTRGRGPLQVRSVEGLVRVIDLRGRLHAASINRAVQLERVIGLIDAESVNGDIDMQGIDSQDVDASSVNGSVQFDGPFQPRGRYRLVSHNGNLRVGVPVGADVDVSVSAFRGAFESGIPVAIGPHGKGRRFTFTLGDGGSSLELQSFQGLIQLLRSQGLPVPPHVPAPPAPSAPQEDR